MFEGFLAVRMDLTKICLKGFCHFSFARGCRALKGCYNYNTQEWQNQERQACWEVVSFSLSERSGLGVGAGRRPGPMLSIRTWCHQEFLQLEAST